jgi:hypothetical protein
MVEKIDQIPHSGRANLHKRNASEMFSDTCRFIKLADINEAKSVLGGVKRERIPVVLVASLFLNNSPLQ